MGQAREARRSDAISLFALASLVGTLVLSAPVLAQKTSGAVVFVVNAGNPTTDVTSAQLRRIYLGDETRWASNEKITILLLPAGREERRVLLGRLLKMSDDDYVRHWIGKVFQGEATSGPKTVSSPASMEKLVAGISGAIGFLGNDVAPDASLKVLRVDGKVAGEKGYLFEW